MQGFPVSVGAYLRRHVVQRRVLIGVAIGAVLLGVILVALPILVAGYAEDWLRDQGAADARIDDVDINPFTGVARVTGLAAGESEGARLSVDLAEVDLRWWPLVSRRAVIERVRLEGVHADVVAAEDGVWQIGALSIPPAREGAEAEVEVQAEDATTWGFGSELVSLEDVHVSYADGVYDTWVDVRELSLGSHFSWESGRSTDLVMDLEVNGSPLVLRSDVAPWAEAPSLSGRLTLADLDLADFADELESVAGLRGSRGQIAMDLEISGHLDDGVLRIEIIGPFNLNQAGFEMAGATIAHDAFRWEGTLALALPAQADEPLLDLVGALQLTGLEATVPDQQLEASLGDIRWNGELALASATGDGAPGAQDTGALRPSGRAGLLLRNLSLRHTGLDTVLAGLDQVRVRDLRITGPDAAEVDGIAIEGLRLLAGSDAGDAGRADLVTIDELEARSLVVESGGVRLAALRIDEPVIVLVRDEAGGIEGLSAALAAFDEAPGEAAEAESVSLAETAEDAGEIALEVAEATPPFSFELGELEVQGSRWFDFVDRSVSPPVDFEFADLALKVENVSTRDAGPMKVDLATGADNTRLVVSGTLGVLQGPPSADLEVDLDGLELPPFSPYVPGYDVFRGRASTDTTVSLKGDDLNVQNELVLARLKLAGKGGDADDLLSQGMAMPVDVALDLLRDRDDRINLSLPVTGSLSNPSFGTGDIVRQAMQKALQNAALAYVKNALQPLGTLLLVGDLAAKAARPRFEPVTMPVGEADLGDDGRAYLDKLAGLLAERPGLSLTLCGAAVPADREALLEEALARQAAEAEAANGDAAEAAATASAEGKPSDEGDAGADQLPTPEISTQRLLELAGVRTTRVVTALVERGVDRDRLFACRESVEEDADAVPRVEITL